MRRGADSANTLLSTTEPRPRFLRARRCNGRSAFCIAGAAASSSARGHRRGRQRPGTLAYDGSPPIARVTLPACGAHYPGGSPLSHFGRVGIRIMDFEACSGFTRVTARWIARPPEAAFVTRLWPVQLPVQAARQLPDQSTSLWAEPSSAGDTRVRGASKRTQFSSASASSLR
jgi:hypothetical protein